MWVVKIGGSLLGAPELTCWLDVLVKNSDEQIIIVPGGGVFADAVRLAQKQTGISEADAHQLAVLAMDQFGWLLTAMNPALVTAQSELELAERGWQHRCVVWLPSQMVLADESMPKNWQVTSDSISAWLAAKLGAQHLILVKSASRTDDAESRSVSLKTLIAEAVIDQQFADFSLGKGFKTWLVNKRDSLVFTQGSHPSSWQEKVLSVHLD